MWQGHYDLDWGPSSGRGEGHPTPSPLFLAFCSHPMRSRDFPLALAFSRLEEMEKTATQAIVVGA